MITSVNAGATQSTGKTRRPVYSILKRGLVAFAFSIAAAPALAQMSFLDLPSKAYITGQTGQVHMEMTCDLDICDLERSVNGSYVLQKTTTLYRDTFAPALPTGTHRFLFRRCSWTYQGYVRTRGMCFTETKSVEVLRIGSSPSVSGPSTNYTGSYTLSWSSSSNTKTYQLQERYNNGSWSTIHNSSSRSKSRSSRKVGTYQYRLRSCADGKCVSYGSTKTVKVASLSRPAITLAPTSKSKTFTVSWDKVSGAEFYVLERSPKNDGTNGWEEICRKKEKDCKSTSKQNTVPSDGTYSYRVQACNSLGCSPHSAVKKINVAQTPKIHEIIVPDGNTNGEFNVSWTPSDVNVTRFELERKDLGRSGSDFGSRMTITDATVAPQTIDAVGSYIFRVRAVNSVGGFENESAWVESKTIKVALPSAVPNIELDIESDTGRYTVSWKPINNTDSYVLEESVDQSASWTTVEEKLKENSKLFTKTDSNHYRYRVTACNRLGCTEESSSKGINVVHTPQLTSPLRVPTEPTDGYFKVDWDDADGAVTYYEAKYLHEGEIETVTPIYSTATDVLGLDVGGHRVSYRACNSVSGPENESVSCSDWRESEPVIVSKPASAPVLELDDKTAIGEYTFSWDEVDNANLYLIEESPTGAENDWTTKHHSPVRTVKINKDHNGRYYYRAAACNAVGCSEWTETVVVDIALTPGVPGQPELVGSNPKAGEYTIEWAEATGSVSFYELQETSTEGAVYSGEHKAATFEQLPGQYAYQVRACRVTNSAKNCSAWTDWSDPVEVVGAPERPNALATSATSTGDLRLAWDYPATEWQPYFYVDYEVGGDEQWHALYEGTGTSAVLDEEYQPEIYRFRIVACRLYDEVPICSDTRYLPEPVDKPVGTLDLIMNEASTSGNFDIAWNHQVWGVQYYRITESGSADAVTDLTINEVDYDQASNRYTYPVRGRINGSYTYQIQACNEFGCSQPSETKTVDVAIPPEQPELTPNIPLTDGKFRFRWQAGAGAISDYHFEVGSGGDNWVKLDVADVGPNTYAVNGLPAGIYQLRACITVGAHTACSAYENATPITVAVPSSAPANLTAPSLDYSGTFTVSWDSVTNTREYHVQEKAGPEDWTTVAEVTGTDTLIPYRTDGLYLYRVLACNTVGCSDASNEVSTQVVIRPVPPASVDATPDLASGKTPLQWSGVDNATYYEATQRYLPNAWPNDSQAQVFTSTSVAWPESITQSGDYEYRVRACRQVSGHEVCSGWKHSPVISYLAPTSDPSVRVMAVNEEGGSATELYFSTNGQYFVAWDAITYATHYELEENSALVSPQAGTSWEFDGQKSNGVYTYRVRACNAVGCTAFSQARSVWVDLEDAAKDDDDDDGNSDGGDGPGGPDGPGSPPDDNGSSPGANIRESGFLLDAPGLPEQGRPVGATEGQFRVNESGAATYTIPLNVPVGTAGVTPQVSFSYSSQAGQGLLGQGWSIGGLSAIQRCRQTAAQDGKNMPITWSSDDRLCIDGQRLMQVSSGAYGASGTVYRTEIDSYIEVTAKGGGMNSPTGYFVVKAKDGSTRTYGGTPDSLLGGRNGTLIWAESRFEDNMKNRIDYIYSADAQTGHRISKIEYAFPGQDATAPGASIEFSYENCPSCLVQTSYVGGDAFNTRGRLSAVTVRNRSDGGLAEYRRYNLEYYSGHFVTTDKLSRLKSVQECVGTTCLEKTTFSWPGLETADVQSLGDDLGASDPPSQEQALYAGGFEGPEIVRAGDAAIAEFQHIDISGDGKAELLWLEARQWDWEEQTLYVAELRPGGETYSGPQAVTTFRVDLTSNVGTQLHAVDYNGDGRMDLITRHYDPQRGLTWRLFISTPKPDGTGWELKEHIATTLPFADEASVVFGDLNGDGLLDAYYLKNNKLHVHYLKPRPEASPSSNRYYEYRSSPEVYAFTGLPPLEADGDFWVVGHLVPGITGDFNGDGSVNVVVRATVNEYRWDPGPGGGTGWQYPYTKERHHLAYGFKDGELQFVSQLPVAEKLAHAVDLNNDGLSDLIYRADEEWKFAINTGAGWNSPVTIPALPYNTDPKHIFIADVNRDLHPDILVHFNSRLHLILWDGDKFSGDRKQYSTMSGRVDESWFSVLDIDGDGWLDVSLLTNYSGAQHKWSVRYSDHQGMLSPNLMIGIKDGLGHQTAINYDTLTHTNRYSRVDVGNPVSRELDEVCVPRTELPGSSYYCYTPIEHTLNTNDFYRALNDPFSALPEGNQSLSSSASPVLELYAPMPVVTDVIASAPHADNPKGDARTSYYYDQLKFQAAGRGSLGFRRLASVDHQTGTVTETTYRQDWPFIGMPLRTVTRTMTESGNVGEGPLLSEAINRWTLHQRTGQSQTKYYQLYIDESVEKQYELQDNGLSQGDLLKTVRTNMLEDSHGNPVETTVRTEGEQGVFIKRIVNQYNGAGGGAKLGRLSSTTVTTTPIEGDPETRTVEFSYYGSGLLKTETVQPGSNKALTKTYEYDDFGNQSRVVLSGADGAQRRGSLSIYDSGRYLDTVVNALGHVTKEVLERNAFGQATKVKDINGVVTDIRYDALGREYQRSDSTGAWTWKGPRYCTDGIECPTGAVYGVEEQVAGGGRQRTYYDVLGRPVRSERVGFTGDWIGEDTEYNALGQVKRVSTPYKTGGSPSGWTESQYDLSGRVIELIQPDGEVGQTVQYQGFTTITTNALGHTQKETRNFAGELVRVEDNLGGTVSYQYDAQGNLVQSTTNAPDANPVTVRMCYDELGQKKAMFDPDKGGFTGNSNAWCPGIDGADPPTGWWGYEYNSLGDLISQTDAKRQRQRLSYDALGRKISRTEHRVDGTVEAHTRWHYDGNTTGNTDPGELGNLTYVVQSYNRVSEACVAGNYCQIYAYDQLGRISGTFTFHPDNSETGYHTDVGYMTSVDYDSIGRPYVEQDALQGLVSPMSGIHRRYNNYGYRTDLIDLASGDLLHQVVERDDWGNITKEERANGYSTYYTYDKYFGRLEHQYAENGLSELFRIQDIAYEWDAVGNLKSRHNQSAYADQSDKKNLRESFCYDGLNRLIKAHIGTTTGGCSLSAGQQDIRYNGLGNITYKHDVGQYTYGTNAGPHAVTQAGDDHYTYDANGNQISGAGRTLVYNTNNKPIQITKGEHTSRFEYGPGRDRFRRTDEFKQNGVPVTKTTSYLGNVERIESTSSNTITWRRTVAGAVYTIETSRTFQQQGETDKAFIYTDHLGSTDVITDKGGNVIQSMSFNAWGQRRDADSWDLVTDVIAQRFTERTSRGYTSHEQLDEVGLIHMNGRIYDPRLARFLQADPFIQAPGNTQSYNRYSYVWNNPLNATDPSGFFLKKLKKIWDNAFRPFVGAIVGAVVTAYCAPCSGVWGAMFAGGAAGAAGAAANNGNVLQGMLTGAVGGAMFYGIGASFSEPGALNAFGRAVTSGSVGGLMAMSQGGRFAHGFAAAGIGSFGGGGSTPAGFIRSAVLGGIASEVTGGKFKNGAATAAFTWALSQGANQLADQSNDRPNFDEMSNQQFADWVLENGDQFGIEFKEGLQIFSVDEYRIYNKRLGAWVTCSDSTCGGSVDVTVSGHYEPNGNYIELFKQAFESGFHSFAPARGVTKAYRNLSREAAAVQAIGHEAAHSMGVDMVRDVAPTHYEAERMGLEAMNKFRRMYEQ